jgi:hypothetical protein
MTLIHKTSFSADTQGLEFVLSDQSADRYDDIILADGWDLANFKRNPITLFNHDANFPIGR